MKRKKGQEKRKIGGKLSQLSELKDCQNNSEIKGNCNKEKKNKRLNKRGHLAS
ncbi:MAG TPA: hypothetical protein VIK55_03960 [Paludibacter sp.]